MKVFSWQYDHYELTEGSETSMTRFRDILEMVVGRTHCGMEIMECD